LKIPLKTKKTKKVKTKIKSSLWNKIKNGKPWHKVSRLKDGHIMIYYSSLVTLWSINVSFMKHILLVYLEHGLHWRSILGQALIRHARQANLGDNFLCEFSPKGFWKGWGLEGMGESYELYVWNFLKEVGPFAQICPICW
jgi:hypothetical protein